MLRRRLATAAVAIPLLLLLIFKGPAWMLAVVVGSIAVLGIMEFTVMAFPGRQLEQAFFSALGAVVVGATAANQGDIFAAGIAALVAGGLLFVLFARRDFEAGLGDFGRALVGILYAGYLLSHFVWLRALPDGASWVVFVLMTAMAGDSAGYFVGHSVGRRQLAPRISPGKTVEGTAGILAGNLLAGVAAKLLLLPQLDWLEALLLAGIQGTLGQLGDLCESIMKRTFGAKDSGWLFPGHGGVLDRIDSLVFPVAAVYYYVLICRQAG